MELNLPSKLRRSLEHMAADANRSVHAHIVNTLERITPHPQHINIQRLRNNLPKLVEFLNRIPAVRVLSHEVVPDAFWWIKFDIDIKHRLAWHVVQAFGFVFNQISLRERLPTVFMPVSPPPYWNDGPDQCLSWVVESSFTYIDPEYIRRTLEGRLPDPVEDEANWDIFKMEDDEDFPNFEPAAATEPHAASEPPPLPKPSAPTAKNTSWFARLFGR